MFVAVKRNVLLPGMGRKQFLPMGYVGELDEEYDSKYFRTLVADGDIAIVESFSDKEVVPEMEKPTKTRRKKE